MTGIRTRTGDSQAAAGRARQHGELIAIDQDRYPGHFRALTGFHRELSRLPRVPAVPPLGWDAARQYLARHAADHDVSLAEEQRAARQPGPP